MLSNCSTFTKWATVLKQHLGPGVAFTTVCIGAGGTRYPMTLPAMDTWKLDLGGRTVTGPASQIKELVRAALVWIPDIIVSMEFIVTAGGNEWKLPADVTLSNPEAIAGKFGELFRIVLHDTTGKSGSTHPSNP